ncbi:MAG TPA: hypothetical protein ENL03_00770, partial [Phycisphaerae bacterium]|nr:hypothetical protein [Phycisphaerae bacterium]
MKIFVVIAVLSSLSMAEGPANLAPKEDAFHSSIDTQYEGKYINDPWWNGMDEKFTASAKEGFRRAAAGLGVDLAKVAPSRIRIRMIDAQKAPSAWVQYKGSW